MTDRQRGILINLLTERFGDKQLEEMIADICKKHIAGDDGPHWLGADIFCATCRDSADE